MSDLGDLGQDETESGTQGETPDGNAEDDATTDDATAAGEG